MGSSVQFYHRPRNRSAPANHLLSNTIYLFNYLFCIFFFFWGGGGGEKEGATDRIMIGGLLN